MLQSPNHRSLYLNGSRPLRHVCSQAHSLTYNHTPKLTTSCKVDSFLHSEQRSPKPIVTTTAATVSPAIHSNGPKSPFKIPFLRSTTSPLPSRPASPVLQTPQDSAFPPFPKPRSQDSTPTTPLESSFSFASNRGSPQEGADTATGHVGRGPMVNVGGNLMQRVENIAPSPFNAREIRGFKQSGHSKSPSMGSSRDFVRISRSKSPSTHVQRPSTSSSNYTRSPSLSSTSPGPRSTLDRSTTAVPTVPPVPRPCFQDQSDGSAHVPLPSFDFGSFKPGQRSQMLPKKDHDTAPSESRPNIDRIHSNSSSHSHKPRPSVAVAAMQPLHEIGSTSSFKPSRSVRSRAASPAVERIETAQPVKTHPTAPRDDRRLVDAPPVPVPAQATEAFRRDNAYHQLHESTSSNESYSSGAKSGSSISTPHESTSSNESYTFGIKGDGLRASPPLNESPKHQKGHALDENQANDLFKGFIFDVEQPSRLEKPASIPDERTTGYVQPSGMNAPAPFYPPVPTSPPREDSYSPTTSPDEYVIPSFASHSSNLRMSPAPASHSRYPESTARRLPPTNKGNCRGCGDLIRGKSVSSADGRLTGRYHKQCFVCQICQRPFQTADFYVMNNQPYCARHYHELNDSLCTSCDRGIEGQYLETESRLKFHPYCFSCQECHIILRDDYYEFNGKTLCEQHAFGAARTSTPSSLGPGRRFPERRTTRLMMM